MQINVKHMTAEEVWLFILQRHRLFHTELKHFGYKYNSVVPKPNNPIVKEMFEKETLTDEDIKKYSTFFKQEIYNVNDLTKYDDMISLKQDGYPIDLVYWALVGRLITAYCDFNCLPKYPMSKIQKMLLDPKYAKKYHADHLPDKKFTKLLLDCFNAKSKDKMPAIDKLYKYVMKSGGGFDIGQFRGYGKIEKR